MTASLFDQAAQRAAYAATLVFAAALVPALAAPASDRAADDAERYRSERAACLDGSSPQDRKTCLYEAVSAHDAMRRGLLHGEPAQTLLDNARQRCQIQPEGAARGDCEMRLGDEAVVTGSVAGGGLLRQLTTRRTEAPLQVPPLRP